MSEKYVEIFNLDTRIWNEGKLEAIDQIYAKNFVNHDPSRPDVNDFDTYKTWVAEVRNSMPDHKTIVEDTIISGDMVVARWEASGTHMADYGNIPATGKWAKYSGMTIYRMEENRIAEAWWSYDTFGVLQQLGVIPSMEAA